MGCHEKGFTAVSLQLLSAQQCSSYVMLGESPSEEQFEKEQNRHSTALVADLIPWPYLWQAEGKHSSSWLPSSPCEMRAAAVTSLLAPKPTKVCCTSIRTVLDQALLQTGRTHLGICAQGPQGYVLAPPSST